MAESFANLYVISYIKSTKRQFSYLEVAIAVFTLERSQFLLKFLYVAVKYILQTHYVKNGLRQIDRSDFLPYILSGIRQKNLRKPAIAYKIGDEPKPLIH
jgi:hypothetical protein